MPSRVQEWTPAAGDSKLEDQRLHGGWECVGLRRSSESCMGGCSGRGQARLDSLVVVASRDLVGVLRERAT
jgi:hypothetical protein